MNFYPKYDNSPGGKKLLVRIMITLFCLSVSMTVLPCGLISVHGLFGEVTSAVVTEHDRPGKEQLVSIAEKASVVKGANIYNVWFVMAAMIIFLICISYMLKLPRGDTIVTLRVRMND